MPCFMYTDNYITVHVGDYELRIDQSILCFIVFLLPLSTAFIPSTLLPLAEWISQYTSLRRCNVTERRHNSGA